MAFSFLSRGNYNETEKWLKKMSTNNFANLEKYGRMGVEALRSATPVDSGATANSWYYQITEEDGKLRVDFLNSHVNKNVNIAIVLQYGHGTGTGGYVAGRDYINPAIQPVFDKIVAEALKEVTNG